MTASYFSKLGLKLFTELEGGNKLEAYYDDINKIWKIGIGHTGSLANLKLFTGDKSNLPAHFDILEVYKGLKITEEQSFFLCKKYLNKIMDIVDDFTDYGHYLTNNQLSAITILAYNTGDKNAINSALATCIDINATNLEAPNIKDVEFHLMKHSKGKEILILYNTPDDPEDKEGAFPYV